MPRELVPRVRGGLPGTEENGVMWADYLVEMTTGGEVVWDWRSWDICEGNFGRLFEVTPEGELVWEYVNPHFPMPSPDEAPNNSVFRAFRYSPEEIERARETSREA